MPKPTPKIDVMVLGNHPCAYLAAALLRLNESIRVAHAVIPGEHVSDRLVLVNPEFFDLHPILSTLKRKLDLTAVYGLKFLADDPATEISHSGKTIGAYVGCFKQIHAAVAKLAHGADVTFLQPRQLEIRNLDESGVQVSIDGVVFRPKLLLLAGELAAEQKRLIGQPPAWEGDVPHRYTYIRLKGSKWFDGGTKPIMPMSLDLRGTLNWGWLLPGPAHVQLAVDQSAASMAKVSGIELLEHWTRVLIAHGVLKTSGAPIDISGATTLELPLAGALSQEGVANRTLLIGPAGGFYTACTEDIYPNCWSAVYAVEVAKKALKEKHLQDALQPYRQRWGATLGDYLRGPQQNLRFLLPLVYRNGMMTARLTEAILLGRSVVR
jgi:flavin-dependent dehydrogenase